MYGLLNSESQSPNRSTQQSAHAKSHVAKTITGSRPWPESSAVENPGMIEFFIAGPFDPARMYLLFHSFL